MNENAILMPPNRNVALSAAIALALIFYSILVCLPGSSLLKDGDTYWHIRTGQWILDHAQFPVSDFYSYTAYGQRWIAGEWLPEILFALGYNVGHWRGVVLLTTIAIAVIVGTLCFYLLWRLRFSVAVFWTAMTVMAISPHFLARPHIFSYIVALTWLIVLVENYDRGNFARRDKLGPLALILGALMIVWANSHGSFTFGLGIFCIFAAFACYNELKQRHFRQCVLIVFLAAFVGSCALLNPYGIYAAFLTLQTLNLKFTVHHVFEWASPDFQELKTHLVLLVGVLSAIAGLGIQLQGPRILTFSALLVLCLSYTRGITIFFLLSPIILATPLWQKVSWSRGSQLEKGSLKHSTSDPIVHHLQMRPVAIPATFFVIALMATAFSWRHLDIGPSESITPSRAIDAVMKAGIKGNVFNSYSFGGYLIFRGIPTFIDSRVPPYTDDFVRSAVEASGAANIKDAFNLLDQYKVSWAILKPEEPLANALSQSTAWHNIYSDKFSVAFVRRR